MQSMVIISELIIYLIVFGLIYYTIRTLACKNFVYLIGWKGFMFFSFIGTPLHELSHLVAAIIFGHKINDVVLFSPKKAKQTGELGHVNHSWNLKSKYQNAGNFFIGVAPMIVGVLSIILMIKFMFPEYASAVIPQSTGEINFLFFVDVAKNMFLNIDKLLKFNRLEFYIFIFVSISIVLHMSISIADLKNSFLGIFSLLFISSMVVLTLSVVFNIHEGMISFLSNILYYVVFGMILGFILLALLTIISLIAVLIKILIKKSIMHAH